MEKRSYYKRKNASKYNDARYIHHELKCIVCGNIFVARRISAMYCSDICAKHASIQRIHTNKQIQEKKRKQEEAELFSRMLIAEEEEKKKNISYILASVSAHIEDKEKLMCAKRQREFEEEQRLLYSLMQEASNFLLLIKNQEMPNRFRMYIDKYADIILDNISNYIQEHKTIEGLFYQRNAPYIFSVSYGDDVSLIGKSIKILWISTEKVNDFYL